jgi:putative endonuclease
MDALARSSLALLDQRVVFGGRVAPPELARAGRIETTCGEPFDSRQGSNESPGMVAYAYMLRCSDDSYYVGSTRHLWLRLWEHQEGLGSEYTKRRLPVELVWSQEFENVGEAFFWEKRIQNWSRAKREALIRHDFEALPGLAKKDFSKRRKKPDPEP